MTIERSWLKSLMKSREITKKELAALLGINVDYLSLVLKGEKQEHLSTFLAFELGEILGVDVMIMVKMEEKYRAYRDEFFTLCGQCSEYPNYIYEIYKEDGIEEKKHISTEVSLEQLYQQIVKLYIELGDADTAEFFAEQCIEGIRKYKIGMQEIPYPEGLKFLDGYVIYVVARYRRESEQRAQL